ncbi:uncharacterized protein LOC124138043 [Haliotis rufescens]|uniref:uncharacterized protein LOC124138043 n=1 Tax=Haliotis rufescens TaxID=6454 RepID=UPI00201ED101|nr:uncharacterized protein LOC124138043 [Haliotis rufescens]
MSIPHVIFLALTRNIKARFPPDQLQHSLIWGYRQTMIPKLCLFFLTVIQISAAMEFQSLLPSSFSQNQFHPPSDTGKEVKNAVNGVRRHEIRLEKQEELLEKQEERLGQLNDSLKAHEKLNEVQDQLLSTMQASQLDEKSRLSTIEEKLHQLEDKLVIAENASSPLTMSTSSDSVEQDGESGTDGTVKKRQSVNFTSIQDAGLSFALIMEAMEYSEVKERCAQMVDGGRLIALDSESKFQAMKTYLTDNVDGNPNFYVGLKKARGQKVHHWSTGKKPDDNLWCKGPGKKHAYRCAILSTKHRKGYCLSASRCKVKRYAICESPL